MSSVGFLIKITATQNDRGQPLILAKLNYHYGNCGFCEPLAGPGQSLRPVVGSLLMAWYFVTTNHGNQMIHDSQGRAINSSKLKC